MIRRHDLVTLDDSPTLNVVVDVRFDVPGDRDQVKVRLLHETPTSDWVWVNADRVTPTGFAICA